MEGGWGDRGFDLKQVGCNYTHQTLVKFFSTARGTNWWRVTAEKDRAGDVTEKSASWVTCCYVFGVEGKGINI